MLKKLAIAFAGVALAVVAGCPLLTRSASTVSQTFLLTNPGATAVLSFNGQLQCEVQVNGPNQAIASTPQYSSDGVTWVAAANINKGSITAPGTYISSSQPAGYTSLRLNVASFVGSQLSGTLVCGDSLPAGGGAGGVASVNASPPITVTGSAQNPYVGIDIGLCLATDGILIYYSCATPGPQDTASPNADSPVVVASSYPYHIGCTTCSTVTPTPFPTPSPAATSTAGAPSAIWTTSAGNPQLSIKFPTGGGGSGLPFGFVQSFGDTFGNSTSFTLTLPATATASDTLMLVVGTDAGVTLTGPSGYTQFFDKIGTGTLGHVAAYTKAAAGSETNVTVTTSGTASCVLYFAEFPGSHSQDHSATAIATTGDSTSTQLGYVPPSITPSSGSLVFTAASYGQSNTAWPNIALMPGPWVPIFIPGIGATSGQRSLVVLMQLTGGAGTALSVPPVMVYNVGSSSFGAAVATFSIL